VASNSVSLKEIHFPNELILVIDFSMKTLRVLVALVMLSLPMGCATCRQQSGAQAPTTIQDAPWWQQVVGFLFGFAANSAYYTGTEQQRTQSGDPTR
jgi:hypothetical protein